MTTGRSSSRDGAPDSAGFLWRVGVGTLHYLVRPRQISHRDPKMNIPPHTPRQLRADPPFTDLRRTEPSPA